MDQKRIKFFRGHRPRTIPILSRGFTLVELMIAILVVSALSMGVVQYLKRQQMALRDAASTDSNKQETSVLQKRFRDDLQQAVYLNPTCTTNPAPNVTVTTDCANVPVRGAITPFPGATVDTLDALTVLTPPANLTAATSTLTSPYDAVRILRYDFDGSFTCRLNRNRAVNPSSTAGSGSGAERLWVDSECIGLLGLNRLYIIVDVFDTDLSSSASSDLVSYSNLFQVTALADTPGVETQVDLASLNNRFNQLGGLGLSGFTNRARIFPVKFVEYAFQPDAGSRARGIYRREIRPDAGSPTGYGAWQLIEPDADGLQFYPLTVSATAGAIEHNRTMQFTADTRNDGIEDIRGISPRVVLKSQIARTDGATFDNPMTATVETDSFPRSEAKFFVEMRNTQTSN